MQFWKHPHWMKFGFIVFAIALVLGAWAYTHYAEPKPELTGIAKEMRDKPAAWLELEKDGTALTKDLRAGKVAAAGLALDSVLVSTTDGVRYYVKDLRGYFGAAVSDELSEQNFQLVVLDKDTLLADQGFTGWVSKLQPLVSLLPLVLLGVLLNFVRLELNSASARLVEKAPDLSFDDVVGAGEAKAALQDIVSYLKDPDAYAKMGVRPPKGVLLLGGPGVGKTLLAKALAGESGANFIAASGSDFTAKYYGVGIAKVKKLFRLAREHAPCILFIDEMDGLNKRTSDESAAGSENNRILNQVLVELDGFEANEGVIVVGATNLPENLDPALLREGRMDRRVSIKLPDVRERETLFKLATADLPLEQNIDFAQLARLTTGLSPATIDYIANNAGLRAVRDQRSTITMADLTEAIEISRMGEADPTRSPVAPDERKRIAAHEAGHAIVAAALGSGKVEKVTILPRGDALGVTLVTPEQDKALHLKRDLEHRIQVLLAGRNAELAMFEEASSGAAHDLQEASRLALAMVSRYGFSEDGSLFSVDALPPAMAAQHTSEMVRKANEVLTRLNHSCQELLGDYTGAMSTLTNELLSKEVVEGEYVRELVARPAPLMAA